MTESGRKDAGREVPVAPVADDEHDGGAALAFGHLLGRPARAARGNAGEDAFLPNQLAAGFFGIGLGDGNEFVPTYQLGCLTKMGLSSTLLTAIIQCSSTVSRA